MKSLEELKAIRERASKKINLRGGGEGEETKILVGMGTCGISAGARETLTALLEEVDNKELKNVYVSQVGCQGNCFAEPIVQVNRPNEKPVLYGKVTPDKVKEIIEKHVVNGEVVKNLVVGSAFH